jgi:hypothetical protein
MLPRLSLNNELSSCEPILLSIPRKLSNAESNLTQIASHLSTTTLLEENEI